MRINPRETYRVWAGPSRINRKPINLFMTTRTRNKKTGPMLQTWILDGSDDPITAMQSGTDTSVCGDCPHKGTTCYVNLGHGPLGIYDKSERLDLPSLAPHLDLSHKNLRLGAYGDPCAVAPSVIRKLVSRAKGHTGYTHGWRKHQWLAEYVMASVESPKERKEAKALGFRTFRITHEGQGLEKGEIWCPSPSITCDQCLLCDGNKHGPGVKDVAIPAHGRKYVPMMIKNRRLADEAA